MRRIMILRRVYATHMPDAPFPDWVEPMAATLTQERFTGPEWIFERKLDGIRLLAFKHGADVRLLSRNRLPQHLPAIADGDRRAAGARRDPRRRSRPGTGASRYHVFDVLWLDGRDVTSLPLDERRALLARAAASSRRCSACRRSTMPRPWERACREGWEGVIAKRRDSPYEHRRSPHWLKMKCEASQELVVGGFTDPQGARVGLGALLVGYFEGDDFVFAGKVGTGFDTKLLLDLRARLDALEIAGVAVHEGHRPAARCARTGCVPRSSCRSRSSNGRCTASCAIRGCSASAPTRPAARGRAGRRSRPVITHPEKVLFPDDGITKGELAAYYEAIAPLMLPHIRGRPVTMERYPRGHRREGLLAEGRLEGLSRLARARRGAEEGRHGPPSARQRRALAALAGQPEHHHAARVDLARAGPLSPRPLRLRPRSVARRRPGRAARGRARRCAISCTSSACRAG